MVDVQNQHTQRTIQQSWHSLQFKLEVDGKWTGKFYPTAVDGPDAPLTPGQEWINVPLVLRDSHYFMGRTSSASGGPARFSQLLGPGRHTIRVDIEGAISNPIEIEVVAKSDEKVGATPEASADLMTAESSVEATGAKRGDHTSAGAWGSDSVVRPRFAGEGSVVDEVSGKPVEQIAVQTGAPRVGAPKEIIWITALQSRKGIRGGRFQVSHGWVHGGKVRIRIVADGYLPEAVIVDTKDGLLEAPLVIRLRRGKAILGRVVDHAGKGVAGAKVFLGGPERYAEIRDGKTEHRSRIRKETDAQGRFVLHGAAKENLDQIVVLAPSLHVWTVPVRAPEAGKLLTVKLPQPATLVIRYRIKGEDPIGQFRLELKTWEMPGWKGVLRSVQNPTAKNQGEVVLKNMTPGVYDVIRTKSLRVGNGGRGVFCDRRDVTLKPGKTTTIQFVRKRGHPIEGELVGLEHTQVPGAYVYVRPPEATGDPEARDEWKLPIFDGVVCVRGGKFKTALIEPGQYKIVAHAYEPERPGGGFSTGWRLPAYVGTAMVRVPADGPPPPVRIEMKPRAARRKAPPVTAPPKPAAKPTVEAASSDPVEIMIPPSTPAPKTPVVAADSTEVTREGLKKLQKALPNVRVTPSIKPDTPAPADRPATVSGKVLGADGKPLAGVPLAVKCIDQRGKWVEGRKIKSDARGRFKISGLSPGEIFICYERGDENVSERTGDARMFISHVRVEAGKVVENVVVDLSKATCVVKGQLVDAEGNGIAGASVRAFYAPSWVAHVVWTETDEHGRYRIAGLPPHEFRVFAHSKGHYGGPGKLIKLTPGRTETIDMLAYIASHPAAEPKPDDPRWGRPRGDLRAAIELRPSRETYAMGEIVELKPILRNTSKKTVTLVHDFARAAELQVTDEAGKTRTFSYKSFSGRTVSTTYVLQSGHEVEMQGSVRLKLVGVDSREGLVQKPGLLAFAMKCRPGAKYTLSYDLGEGFRTGEVHLVVNDRIAAENTSIPPSNTAGAKDSAKPEAGGGKPVRIEMKPRAARRKAPPVTAPARWGGGVSFVGTDTASKLAR